MDIIVALIILTASVFIYKGKEIKITITHKNILPEQPKIDTKALEKELEMVRQQEASFNNITQSLQEIMGVNDSWNK